MDTFNNHWRPAVPVAAVEVLERAGLRVLVPRASLCCGRPLYDYGMLPLAKRLLREVLDEMQPFLDAGVPIVGLGPSCIAVFRDELVNLFPEDERAQKLKRQSFLLDEFLHSKMPGWRPPTLKRTALVHGHCHQKALLGTREEEALLHEMGVDARVLESGCCGMAGAFGYEKERYAVSIACGERKLLPAVRGAPTDAVLVSDGFSCREQIRQQTSREALHLAQVLQMAHQQAY